MAEFSDKGDFWLPSDFLPEDFFVDENARMGESYDGGTRIGDDLCFPCKFPYDYGSSNLTSPVESITETESDDDKLYMTGLACQLAYSFLHGDNKNHPLGPFPVFFSGNHHKKMSMASSPQSPLCSAGAWSKIPPKISPPSSLGTNVERKGWEEKLHSGAGIEMRTRFEEGKGEQLELQGKLILRNRGLLDAPANTSKGSDAASHHKSSVSRNQLKQLSMLKQRQQSSVEWGTPLLREKRGADGSMVDLLDRSYSNNNGASTYCARSSHTNNGMRAVFLATPASRKQSCGGTGVFLPRSAGCPTEHRTKPACSTVLLPARVVQALNLNLDEIGPHGRVPGGFILDHESMIARNNIQWMYQKKVFRPQPPRMHHDELRLPTEWTY